MGGIDLYELMEEIGTSFVVLQKFDVSNLPDKQVVEWMQFAVDIMVRASKLIEDLSCRVIADELVKRLQEGDGH